MEEFTAILVKEKDDDKLNGSRSITMVSHQVDKSKKFFQIKGQGFKLNGKKFSAMKSKGPKDGAHHMGERNKYFNGRCSYYKKVGHKKVECWKLKGKMEKKGNILIIETTIIDLPMNT